MPSPARYRTGDGDGASLVSPAASCVQDSNQALFLTIQQIKQAVESQPQIRDWLHGHPNDPQTQRFQQLVQLGQALEENLVPLGIVRSDWRQNAARVAGTGTDDNIITSPIRGLTSFG